MLCVRVWLTHRKMASNCLVFKRTKENTAVQQLLQFVSLRTFLKNEIERERSVCCHGDIPLNKRLARLQSFVMIRIFYRRILSSFSQKLPQHTRFGVCIQCISTEGRYASILYDKQNRKAGPIHVIVFSIKERLSIERFKEAYNLPTQHITRQPTLLHIHCRFCLPCDVTLRECCFGRCGRMCGILLFLSSTRVRLSE